MNKDGMDMAAQGTIGPSSDTAVDTVLPGGAAAGRTTVFRDADLLDVLAIATADLSTIAAGVRTLVLDAYHRLALDPFVAEEDLERHGATLRSSFGDDLQGLSEFVSSGYPVRKLQAIVSTYAIAAVERRHPISAKETFLEAALSGRELSACLQATGIDYFVAMGWAHAAFVDGTASLEIVHRSVAVLALDSIVDGLRPRKYGLVGPPLSKGERVLLDHLRTDLEELLGKPIAVFVQSRMAGRGGSFPRKAVDGSPSRARAVAGLGLDVASPDPFKYPSRHRSTLGSDPLLEDMLDGQRRGYPSAVLDLRPGLFCYPVRRSMVECLRHGLTTSPICGLSGMSQQSRIFWIFAILRDCVPNPDGLAPEDADLFLAGVLERCDDRRIPRFSSTEEFLRIWQRLLETGVSATARGWNESIMKRIERYAQSPFPRRRVPRSEHVDSEARNPRPTSSEIPPMKPNASLAAVHGALSGSAPYGVEGDPIAAMSRDGVLSAIVESIAVHEGALEALDPETVGELIGFVARTVDDLPIDDPAVVDRYGIAWERIRKVALDPRIGAAPSEKTHMIDSWFARLVPDEAGGSAPDGGWFHLLAGDALVVDVVIEDGSSREARMVFDHVVDLADKRCHLGPLVIRTDAEGLDVSLTQAVAISNAGRHTTTTMTEGVRVTIHPRPSFDGELR